MRPDLAKSIPCLSGRIQTPTLNLVVRRDAAIDNFVAYPYYTLSVDFQTASKAIFSTAWQVPEHLQNSDGLCIDKTFVPPLPRRFPVVRHKSPRQNASSRKHRRRCHTAFLPCKKKPVRHWGCRHPKVLAIAQDLYEKHKITSYPRTPCRYLPKSQQGDVATILMR